MTRKKTQDASPLPDDEPAVASPALVPDAGALIQKDRAGPIRELHPMTEGKANFASMADRARETVALANASAEEAA
jgi:hypothetical protein